MKIDLHGTPHDKVEMIVTHKIRECQNQKIVSSDILNVVVGNSDAMAMLVEQIAEDNNLETTKIMPTMISILIPKERI